MNTSLFAESGKSSSPAEGWYTAHCDGGSRGNPGPAAYGAVVHDPQGREVARLSEFLGRQTNNYAEYSGLLAVLAWAVEHGARNLRVVSDSELMVNQMKGRYKVASLVLRPMWQEAKRLAAELARFEMRHTLRDGNQEADRLANEAMDKGSGKTAARLSQPAKGHPASKTLEGVVRDGVVHLLNGDLPEGTRVTVLQKQER